MKEIKVDGNELNLVYQATESLHNARAVLDFSKLPEENFGKDLDKDRFFFYSAVMNIADRKFLYIASEEIVRKKFSLGTNFRLFNDTIYVE